MVTKNNPQQYHIFYKISTVIIALAFFITGIGNLIPFQHIANDMARLGYPTYFLKIFGIWKILAAVVLVIPNIPRIKEWAYAGMIFDLTGAAFSRLAMGDPLAQIIIPICIAMLVTVNYLLRHSLQNQANS